MSLPTALALMLCLFGATLAHAQEAPTHASRRRSVTTTGSPVEVRIAPGARTVYVFDVPIQAEAKQGQQGRTRNDPRRRARARHTR